MPNKFYSKEQKSSGYLPAKDDFSKSNGPPRSQLPYQQLILTFSSWNSVAYFPHILKAYNVKDPCFETHLYIYIYPSHIYRDT